MTCSQTIGLTSLANCVPVPVSEDGVSKISKAVVWPEAGIIKPIDVLDVLMTAPAGFVVVSTTITADEETAGAKI